MKNPTLLFLILVVMLATCQQKKKSTTQALPGESAETVLLPKEIYLDKLRGMLYGSALGDAMGAPTEMWFRSARELDFGLVGGLDSMVRAPSAEGTWRYNLPAGGTTDDTRWKVLAAEFALAHPTLDPTAFAHFLTTRYRAQLDSLKHTDGFDPAPYEASLMRVAWLQEWALVAKPYAGRNLDGYADALAKFYGGEPTCAGMLYSPVVGAMVPANPTLAYEKAYRLAIFDQGYARDLTALVAAMVSAGFDPQATPETVLGVVRSVDPKGYFKSRLVGRSAYRFFSTARRIVDETRRLTRADLPKNFRMPRSQKPLDSLETFRMNRAFERLDEANEDLPFHPGEIFLTVLTGLMYSDFDFDRTMAFVVNYGRDNDTAAAIAGAILGAYHGAAHLPKAPVERMLRVNRETLGIDLEGMAGKMSAESTVR